MMQKKIDWSREFIQKHQQLFACPYCHSAIESVDGYSMVCMNRHRFDINKKGTLHLMKQKANEDYDAELFTHRYELAQSGFFNPLLDEVLTLIPKQENQLIVDIGCGEGSPLAYLSPFLETIPLVGMDIAKEGILAASHHHSQKALWIVADLAQLPFGDESCCTLINMLTPSNYKEFNRVLTLGGKLIKIIPGSNYLIELRQQLYKSNQEKQHYSNKDIVERFKQEYPSMKMKEVSYQVTLTKEMYEHLLQMTPLYWGASIEDQEYSKNHPLETITVHLWILVGEKN